MPNVNPFRTLTAAQNAGKLATQAAATLSTTDGTSTVFASFPILTGNSLWLNATICGRRTDGANAGDSVIAKFEGLYKNVAGVVSLVGAATISLPYASASLAASVASAVINGTQVDLKIAGVAAASVNWTSLGMIAMAFT